ncbi:carotenoid oxygenase family protein [Rhodococcus sp. O3]|uniref:carotenoid oxygenase family protein n=1 Tax=Rhodococcus sp. O3 TaxID=3404919 RepID=UPI003B674B97
MTAAPGSGVHRTAPLGSSPWDSLHREHDYTVDEITGRIPDGLRGTLYRIGPGRLDVAGHPVEHIFDGDGMISRLHIDDDGIGFRNRYVRTRSYRRSNRTAEMPRGFGTPRRGGPLANALRFPANMANTNAIRHGDRLYALWEGGKPHALDPATLDTLGVEDFGGRLKRLGAFSAHPKIDPHTGDLYNFGLDFYPRPLIRCYRRTPRGAFTEIAAFPIPKPAFVHDFALTARHLVFVVDPLIVARPVSMLLGLRSMDHALTFTPEKGTTVVLVPRDGGRPVQIDHPALFHFHITNAYEDDDTTTVVDVVAHDPDPGWEHWNRHLRDYRGNAGPAFGGILTRLRIDRRNRRITREVLGDRGCEFPQLDPRRTTTAHRYTYLAEASVRGGDPDSIATVDHTTGTTRRFVGNPGDTVCEPLFAPASDTEGDGWLLTVQHSAAERRSRVLILPADRPDAGPVATLGLRHHVPMTFHGTFVPH